MPKKKTSISVDEALWKEWIRFVVKKTGSARKLSEELEKAMREYMRKHDLRSTILTDMARWCKEYGLKLDELPSEHFRADAVITGKRVLVLIKIAETCNTADVYQLLMSSSLYEQEKCRKPDALILYVYAESPSDRFIRRCEELGIIVSNDIPTIMRKIAELDERIQSL